MSLDCRILLASLSLVCLTATPINLAKAQAIDFTPLETVIQERLKATNTPGMAIGIVQGDQLVYAKGFGVANIETGEKLTPETLFRLGSSTKIFTATMLLTLAEAGKLDLHAPIGRYMSGLSPKVAQVTAHQLLSFTAGLPWDSVNWGAHDDAALMTTVRAWTDSVLMCPPGTALSYSNPSYWLAGALVEALTGKAFADQMREGLFTPLGMRRSAFRVVDAVTYPVSQGHAVQGQNPPTVVRPFVDAAVSYPSSQMFSNVQDLARFAIAFLNNGRLDGQQVLAPTVIQRLSTAYVDIPTRLDGGRMGYSIVHRTYRGIRMLEWGGNIAGYSFLLWLVPEQRVAVIIQANQVGVAEQLGGDTALELLLPLAPVQAMAPRPSLSISPAEMARYVGRYVNNAAFNIGVDVFVKDGHLMGRFQYAQNSNEVPLVKVGPDRFRMADPPAPEVVVTAGPDGTPVYLHWGIWTAKKVTSKP